MSPVEEIHVSKLVFIQAPKGFLEKMSTQVARWYHIEAHPVWFMSYDWIVRVNQTVPPGWVSLFRALAEEPPDYGDAEQCIKDLREERDEWFDDHGHVARIETSSGQRIVL